MSDYRNVSNEQLLREFHVLQDEYIKMKKMYEDLFYNLDIDNLSPELKADMNKFNQTFSEVFPNGDKYESSITQTAYAITLAVAAERSYMTNLLGAEYYTREQTWAQISIESTNIKSTVSATYETKSNAGYQYTSLQTSITQTAESITSEVEAKYETKDGVTQKISIVKQTADKISWLVKDGTSASNFTLTSRMATLVADEINLTGYVKFIGTNTYPAGTGSNITAINGGNITTGFISADRIQASSITLSKLSETVVRPTDIGSSGTTQIDGGRITTGYISADRIQAGAITADKIAAGAITADKIVAGAITANKIAAGAITANMITSGTMSADRISGGTITGASIKGGDFTTTGSNTSIWLIDGCMYLGRGSTNYGLLHINNFSQILLQAFIGYSLSIQSANTMEIATTSASANIRMTINSSVRATFTNTEISCSAGYNLGTSTARWGTGYLTNIDILTSSKLGSSSTSTLGFFGTTPVSRRTVANTADVATLITALKAYGLIA